MQLLLWIFLMFPIILLILLQEDDQITMKEKAVRAIITALLMGIPFIVGFLGN